MINKFPRNTHTSDQARGGLLQTLLQTTLRETEAQSASVKAAMNQITTLAAQIREMQAAIAQVPSQPQPQAREIQRIQTQTTLIIETEKDGAVAIATAVLREQLTARAAETAQTETDHRKELSRIKREL